MSKKDERVGERFQTNEGYLVEIIEYNNSTNVIIEFIKPNVFQRKCNYIDLKTGKIKNPYHPSIFNIGYLGIGKYRTSQTTTKKNKNTNQYKTWRTMLERCYCPKFAITHPSYDNCIVVEEWHNFQNFAEWYDENYYELKDERVALDKDILKKGNKLYSPSTCIFTPQFINGLFITYKKSRGKFPIGVSYNKRFKKYQVVFSKNSKLYQFGFNFDTPIEAFETYKLEKEIYIKTIANKYKTKIPNKLYEAMCDYEVEISD